MSTKSHLNTFVTVLASLLATSAFKTNQNKIRIFSYTLHPSPLVSMPYVFFLLLFLLYIFSFVHIIFPLPFYSHLFGGMSYVIPIYLGVRHMWIPYIKHSTVIDFNMLRTFYLFFFFCCGFSFNEQNLKVQVTRHVITSKNTLLYIYMRCVNFRHRFQQQ